MSKKTLRLEDGRFVRQPDRIDSAIYKVTGSDPYCSGTCFPLVFRPFLDQNTEKRPSSRL